MTDSAPPNQLRDPDIFWLHRWLALKETILTTMSDCDAGEPFKGLLGNLLEFGQKQFLYFFLGFTPGLNQYKENEDFEQAKKDGGFGAASPKLIKDYDYPPEYVLRTILDQIAVDFEIIQRAMHQRQHGTEFQQETLNLADKWGQELLGRVKKMFEFSHGDEKVSLHPKVITYFNRSPLIRMIPYDNVALIGIPLTATRSGHRRDLLVIGHELGHYAYWHGQIKGQSIREILRHIVRGEMPYIKNWIEEIFSDVFALVVSQQLAMLPLAVDMLTDNNPGTFIHDNRVHPLDALRPYIFFRTPKIMRKSWSNRALTEPETHNKLKFLRQTVWQNVINPEMGGHVSFSAKDRLGRETVVDFAEAVINLELVIEEVWNNIFLGVYDFSEWKTILAEYQEYHELDLQGDGDAYSYLIEETTALLSRVKEQGDKWFGKFEKELNKTKESKQVTNLQADQTELAYQSPTTRIRTFQTIRETSFEGAIEPEVWKIVFAADGWTVKGPETQPVGGWEGEPSGGHNPFHL